MSQLARHPRSAPGAVARASAVRWGRSVLDWHCHAVDELAEHSGGVYRAQCGHVLLAVTPLRVVPAGWVCDGCRVGTQILDHLWRALPGEPLCGGDCLLVAEHGPDVEDAGTRRRHLAVSVSDPMRPPIDAATGELQQPPLDDPMADLDPWTAGYIRMRQFLESGHPSRAEVEDLAEAIRTTLPFPAPPPDIALIIQADLSLVGMDAPDTPLSGRLWTPPPIEEE